MRLTIYSILRELRALYDVGERNTLDRYWSYKRLMVDGPELLPLGDFSPMGRRQPEYLDVLLAVDAEGLATEYAHEIETELEDVQAEFRLILVVADQTGNGWTQRWLTDAAWRFGPEKVPQQRSEHRWITVQLWTHASPTARLSPFSGAGRGEAGGVAHPVRPARHPRRPSGPGRRGPALRRWPVCR